LVYVSISIIKAVQLDFSPQRYYLTRHIIRQNKIKCVFSKKTETYLYNPHYDAINTTKISKFLIQPKINSPK